MFTKSACNRRWKSCRAETGLAEVYGRIANVAAEDDVQGLIHFAEDKLGGVDILINNAGLGTTRALVDMEDEEWHRVIDVTLNGTMRMTRHMLRVMRDRGRGGVIVNNASVLGWRAQQEQSHYAAAKAGVMALTRCAALEAVEFDVRINAVAPSIVLHPMLRKSASEELLQELESKEAYGRAAEAWEVANVMVFLASDYSSYMTGRGDFGFQPTELNMSSRSVPSGVRCIPRNHQAALNYGEKS
ncbi:MAG: SDR family oxidoreductase [Halioglobus sp.]|nr:SDR family oxidoreductase [Halioglobus sp.]